MEKLPKFATGGMIENGLFIERENGIEFVGKIDDKMIPHSEKIDDYIAKAVSKKLNKDLLNFDYFPQFPPIKSEG